MKLELKTLQSSHTSDLRLSRSEDLYGHVFTVHSLEEAHQALLSTDKKDFQSWLIRTLNKIWVVNVSFLLRLLTFLLFNKRRFKKSFPKHIVVYTTGVLGDNVIRLPAVATLKHKYPDAKITVAISTGSGSDLPTQLYANLPYVDDCVIFSEEFLNRTSCDLFVNLTGSANVGLLRYVLREMLYAYKMGAKYAIGHYVSTYGFQKLLNPIQHHFIENEPRRHLRVLKEIDLSPINNLSILPENKKVKELLLSKLHVEDSDVVAVMVPGAGKQSKIWPSERFAAIAAWLKTKYDARVFLVGDTNEREIAESVKTLTEDSAENLAGKTTIQELIELLRISKICITNDTGTMHIAAILQIPTVAIFNSHLPPTWWFPDNSNINQIFSICKCSYCNIPYCETKECLMNITVDHVKNAVLELTTKSNRSIDRQI